MNWRDMLFRFFAGPRYEELDRLRAYRRVRRGLQFFAVLWSAALAFYLGPIAFRPVVLFLVVWPFALPLGYRAIDYFETRRQDRDQAELDRLQERLDSASDDELRGALADYAEDEVAALFDEASKRQSYGGWTAITLGIAALVAAAAAVWALIINDDQPQTTADALARLAITIPAVYAAGILFKRGGAMQDQGTRLKAAGVAIRAVPLIAQRIKDQETRSEFLKEAYLAQLGGAVPKTSSDSDISDSLVEAVAARLLK